MESRQIQYTLRGVPEHIDHLVRERAAKYGKSLNAVALEALARGLGARPEPVRHHDLDHLAGSWVEDPAFDRAIAQMDVVDDELWS